MKQGQAPLQHTEIKTDQSIFILVLYTESHFGKEPSEIDHNVHLPIVSLLQWSLTYNRYAGKGSCMLRQHKTISEQQKHSKPSTITLQQGDQKDDSEEAFSSKETVFPTCNRLIRQSTQASSCGKFQNGKEIWNDFSRHL